MIEFRREPAGSPAAQALLKAMEQEMFDLYDMRSMPTPASTEELDPPGGGAYVVGGLVPLMPYMLVARPGKALWISALATLIVIVALVGLGVAAVVGTAAVLISRALESAVN